LWCVEDDIIEKGYKYVVESRGVNTSHEGLQVFADPFEYKTCKSGKGSAFRGRWTSAFPVRARLRGLKLKGKFAKAGQYGEASGHCLG
jgi:hypothetical protein